MFRKKWTLFLIIPAALLAGIFFSKENDLKEVEEVTSEEVFPTQSIRNARFIYSDSAQLKFKLFADLLDKYEGIEPYDEHPPYMEFPEGVKVIAFNERNVEESRITAEYAINYERTRIMEARNNVVVVNNKGEQLNTEHLIWDEGLSKIYTDEFVKITTADEIIYGNGLEANETFTKYKIKNPTGEIKIKDEQADDEKVQ